MISTCYPPSKITYCDLQLPKIVSRLGCGFRLIEPASTPLISRGRDALTGLFHEFFSESLLLNVSCHGLDHLGHCWSFPPSA